ncbi:MAG: Hpt domain-containing protein [Clostridiales bacterium]|jgi:HPt (histidine-containing phosphotransfer) domain-containing protein|nr:Hpt domain-containing protein [Clostridiales bacterium]
MGGDDFVGKLRIKFAKEQGDVFVRIQNALKAGDIKGAFLLVHTLKGAAGLIGEPMLVKAAIAAEHPLRHGEMPGLIVMENLQYTLDDVVSAIYIPQRQEVTEWDKAAAAELFDGLQTMLAESSAECFMILDDLEKIPETEELVALIEKCDFAAALDELLELRTKLEL